MASAPRRCGLIVSSIARDQRCSRIALEIRVNCATMFKNPPHLCDTLTSRPPLRFSSMDFYTHLRSIGADFHDPPATEANITYVESLIATRFPDDYRNYLLTVPEVHLPESACIACSEPTPFGYAHFHSMYTISEVEELLDSDITPRNMITIATGNLNKYICFSIAGIDNGFCLCSGR